MSVLLIYDFFVILLCSLRLNTVLYTILVPFDLANSIHSKSFDFLKMTVRTMTITFEFISTIVLGT